MTGWKWHLAEVNRCWGEERWLVWNGCVKVMESSMTWKESVSDDAVKTCVGVCFVAGGVCADLWNASCGVGDGDGVGRVRDGGGAWEAVVVVERSWDELELDQLVV